MTNANTVRESLHQTALKAPSSSGVYLWRDSKENIIYVGKAKNLKHRLASYFAGNKDIKTRLLVSNAKSIEYITTANEYEAFLLENNLIKKHSPRYNINLKDGKSYPVLRITNEDFPRLFKTRNIIRDGSTYFGPYPDAGALDQFVDALFRIYPIRHCKTLKKRDSPCLYYHIGQCSAPCCGNISKDSYNEFFGEISSLLEEKGDVALSKIRDAMKKAAEDLNFEKAARLRDGLNAFSVMQNQNIVESFDENDRDYIAHAREGELVSFTVLKIRGGKLIGRDNHRVISCNEDDELTAEFIRAYYTEKDDVPPRIYVPTRAAVEFLKQWIEESLKCNTDIVLVGNGIDSARIHHAAMNMAFENAREDIIRRLRERGDIPAMEELQKLLALPRLPVRIEGFDIAHIGGKFPVASLISFYNGNPDKKNYRYFRLKTTDGIIDDFASMREATSRRYTRLLNDNAELPDLILIDGGIGQVNAVQGVLESLGLDIPIAGLAKRDEEIWRPSASAPICLPKRSDALRLLQRVRDETHRFATGRNQRLRTKENTVSIFLEITGIGEKRARTLTRAFTSLEDLTAAAPEKIAEVLNISETEGIRILSEAKTLLAARKEKQETQRKSLQSAGTTPQTAAEAQYIKDIAASALAAAERTETYSADSE